MSIYIYIYIKKKVLVISQRALHLLLQLYTLQCSCTRLAQCLVQAALNIFIQNHPQPSFFVMILARTDACCNAATGWVGWAKVNIVQCCKTV